MKIGELARRAGCPAETIRYYEQQGLLPAPARTASNYRVYGEPHLARLAFIRYCRSLDMTLDEIRTLLEFRDAPERNCETVNALLDEHIGHVALRIAELQALERELEALRSLCRRARAARDCGILREIDVAASLHENGRPNGHIGGAHGRSSRS